jgi:hypothetical protein
VNDFKWFQKLDLNKYACFYISSCIILGAQIHTPKYDSESVSSTEIIFVDDNDDIGELRRIFFVK